MKEKLGTFLMNPKNQMITIWVSIAAFVIPTVVTAALEFGDRSEQRMLQDKADLDRLARAEASIMFQEGEITPRSIEKHLEPIMNCPAHDFPQWAKVISYDFEKPKVNCIYLNDAYRESYQIASPCFGKSDREIYAEITGVTDFETVQEGVAEYQINDLLVASRPEGYCLKALEMVYPWWLPLGFEVEVIKCRYDFGDFVVIIGAIPEQERRPELPEFLDVGAVLIKESDIKVVKAKTV